MGVERSVEYIGGIYRRARKSDMMLRWCSFGIVFSSSGACLSLMHTHNLLVYFLYVEYLGSSGNRSPYMLFILRNDCYNIGMDKGNL